MATTYAQIGDKILGERIVAEYQKYQPKKGSRKARDDSGRSEMTLKHAYCIIEKPIRMR